MIFKNAALALFAVLAFVACGKKSDAPRSSTSMEAADVKADSPLDRPYRIRNAKALDIDRFFEVLPLYLRPTYEKAEFNPKTGATIVKNLKFGAEHALLAERAEFYGVDLDAIDRIKSDEDEGLDAPMETALLKLRLFDVKSVRTEDDEDALTIAAIEIDTLRIRRGGAPAKSDGTFPSGYPKS